MADIALEQLTTTWVDLDTKDSLAADKDYLIQNRGADFCLAFVGSAEPAADDVDGVIIAPMMQVHYKKGSGTLYVRAYNSSCSINVSEAD